MGVYDALEKCEARMNRASLDYQVDLVILNEAGVVNQYNYYKKM